MSYILEALKKSQQERGRGQVPDLQTLHQSIATPEIVAPRWPYWALVVALLALAFLLGWLRPWSKIDQSVPEPVVQADVALPVVASSVPLQNKTVTSNAVEPVQQMEPEPLYAEQAVSRQAVLMHSNPAPDGPVPAISQLPSMLQQAIPQMQFSGHVYSNSPQQRSVIINGHFMSEGDELMPGMRLIQITEDSVIFDYQSQRFSVPVLHDWSFE